MLDRSVGGHPGQLLPGGREQDLLSATGPRLLSTEGKRFLNKRHHTLSVSGGPCSAGAPNNDHGHTT